MKIGLIGTPGAGKDDVVAHVLQTQGFVRFAFADQIKKCYYADIGITDEHFKSCRGTPEEDKIRKGLWEFSDKMRIEHGPYFFIDPVIEETSKHANTVITDIRTTDELTRTLSPDTKIIIIMRDYNPTDIEFYHECFPETRIPNRWVYSFLQVCKNIFFEFNNNFDTVEEAREGFKVFYQQIGGI